MCETCDERFNMAASEFDMHLAAYRRDLQSGRARNTPAKRVIDCAAMYQEFSIHEAPRLALAWYLAVAMERLMALESSGIPT